MPVVYLLIIHKSSVYSLGRNPLSKIHLHKVLDLLSLGSARSEALSMREAFAGSCQETTAGKVPHFSQQHVCVVKDGQRTAAGSQSRGGQEPSTAHAGMGQTLRAKKYVHLWCQGVLPSYGTSVRVFPK